MIKNKYQLSKITKFFIFIIFIFLGNPLTYAKEKPMPDFILTSPAFIEGSLIPSRYTCDADNISPPLTWENTPLSTQSLVLILDDPDAPKQIWDHWILYNIPVSTHGIEENEQNLPRGTQIGLNSWGKAEYGGPCPPSGEHRYIFTLYALDKTLNLEAGVSRNSLEQAMKNHIIGQTTLQTRYHHP